MLVTNLHDALTAGGLAREGDSFVAPSGLSVTVYLDVGRDGLVVDRVARVEVGAALVTVVTHRKERYAVELDRVVGVRCCGDHGGPGYA